MKILLDHCVPKRMKRLFPGHDVLHTSDLQWENLANDNLLAAAAAAGFEVMITADKNIRHQQNLRDLPLPVLELNTKFNRFPGLAAIAFAFEDALAAIATC